MLQEIIGAAPVYFFSMLKFILGPAGGYAVGLNLITTILTTVAGMMTVVLVFTFFGNWIRNNISGKLKIPKMGVKKSARVKKIWARYGLAGVALLTPVFLTPIGGTLLAVGSGSPREKIIFYMFVSASFWSVILSIAIYFFGNEVLPQFLTR